MSSSDNDIEPTLTDSDQTSRGTDPSTPVETPAGLDQMGGSSVEGTGELDGNGDEVNPPLPDWGPTDGVHGTDAETGDEDASSR